MTAGNVSGGTMTATLKPSAMVCVAIVIVVAAAALEVRMSVRFGRNEKALASAPEQPSVTFTRPAAGETGVLPNIFVSCDLNLPNAGHGVDADTMNESSVKLYR